MESKVNFLKTPAAGAARIWILYRSPPLKMSKIFGRGGSVRNYPDAKTSKKNHKNPIFGRGGICKEIL